MQTFDPEQGHEPSSYPPRLDELRELPPLDMEDRDWLLALDAAAATPEEIKAGELSLGLSAWVDWFSFELAESDSPPTSPRGTGAAAVRYSVETQHGDVPPIFDQPPDTSKTVTASPRGKALIAVALISASARQLSDLAAT